MAQEDRSFTPGTVRANRAQTRSQGAGQKDSDRQRTPNRDTYATAPQSTDTFDERLDLTAGQDAGRPEKKPQSKQPGRKLDDRNAAGLGAAGDLGAGTPAGVDVHDLDQDDNPQDAWGDEVEEGALFSSEDRSARIDADHTQGAKTRRLNKDIVSRRS